MKQTKDPCCGSFAYAWGRETAAAQQLIFHSLPELQRQASDAFMCAVVWEV